MDKRHPGKKKRVYRAAAALLCVILTAAPAALPVRAEAAGIQKALSLAGQASGRTIVGDEIRPGANEKIPETDRAWFDADVVKEKLREAIRTMDAMGLSPEMLVRKAWEFLNRKESREKFDRAVDDLRGKVRDVTGGSRDRKPDEDPDTEPEVNSDEGSGGGSGAESGQTDESGEKDAVKMPEDGAGGVTEKVTAEIMEAASKKLEEAAGQLRGLIKKKAAEEILKRF